MENFWSYLIITRAARVVVSTEVCVFMTCVLDVHKYSSFLSLNLIDLSLSHKDMSSHNLMT